MKTSILLVLCIMLVSSIRAQSLPPEAKEPAWVVVNDSLVGGLVLDAEQRSRLMDAERRYQRSFDEAMASDTLGDAAMRLRVEALGARREREIRSALSPAQYEQWQRITASDRSTGGTP